MPLTEKQLRFAESYRGDAKAAAVAAGYAGTDGSLRVTASRLLRHPGGLEVLKRRGVRPRTSSRKARRKAPVPARPPPGPAEPAPDLSGLSEEEHLERIIADAGTKPLEQMRALRELRELRELAAADGQAEDVGDAPAGQTVAWVRNGRVPDPAPVVLDALLMLDPGARSWVLEVAARSSSSAAEPRAPWGDLDEGAAASVAELDAAVAGIGSADLRRYVLTVILRDAYAPPVVRARAADLHAREVDEEGSGAA